MGTLCGEVGHPREKVGHHVPALPIHAITYSPSSPHAYKTYSIIKIVNHIYLLNIHEEGSKDKLTPNTVSVRNHADSSRFTHLRKGRKTTFYTNNISHCTNKVVCNLILERSGEGN